MSDNRHVSAQGLWPIFAAIASFIAADTVNCHAQRSSTMLKDGWEFSRDSINWHPVSVPHDWAIYGPFDRSNDLQTVAVAENGEHDRKNRTHRRITLHRPGILSHGIQRVRHYVTAFHADIRRSDEQPHSAP